MVTIIELPGPGNWVKAQPVFGLFVKTRRRPIVVTGLGDFLDPDLDFTVADEISHELIGTTLWSTFDHESFGLCIDEGYVGVYAADLVEPLVSKGCGDIAEKVRSIDELSLVRFRPASFIYIDRIH
ncbi:MAG: hypothetical protein WCI63_03625 [bacterium]